MVYEFSADGMALDAVVVVFASKYTDAVALARNWCLENNLNPNSLLLVHETPVNPSKPCVIYEWDGDY